MARRPTRDEADLMYAERQRALLARIHAHRRAGRSTDEAEMPMTVAIATYTDRLDAELELVDGRGVG